MSKTSRSETSSDESASPRISEKSDSTKQLQNSFAKFATDHMAPLPTHSPLQFFARQQLALSAQQCVQHMNNPQQVSFQDIAELVVNLIELHKRIRSLEPATSSSFVQSLQEFLAIIDALATNIERKGSLTTIDWIAVGKRLAPAAKQKETTQEIDFRQFIPNCNNFEELALLGAGTFGTVYKVAYKLSDSCKITCAMKIVDTSRYKSILTACTDKLVACITSHPFLVQHYASFPTTKAYVTIMEHIDGTDLLTILNRRRYLSKQETQCITAMLILAIKHMHQRGFIHRDIKPSNLLVMSSGHVKLFDYDTVKVCLGHYTKNAMQVYLKKTAVEFSDKQNPGTCAYKAPELHQKESYGRACDWWSVGATIFKMCTGRIPYEGNTLDEIRQNIIDSPPVKWPKLRHSASPALRLMVIGLLDKDPTKRLGSATYDDLMKHSYMKTVEVQFLLNEKNILFDWMAPLKEQSEASTGPSSESEKSTKDSSLTPKKLVNAPNAAELFCWTLPRLKEIMTRLQLGDKIRESDAILHSTGYLSTEIDFSKFLDPMDTLTGKKLRTENYPAKNSRMTIILQREGDKTAPLGIKYSTVRSKSGLRLAVFGIECNTPAGKSSLVCGDIIIAINGIETLELPQSALEGNSVELVVAADNPFRICAKEQNLFEHIKSINPINITLERQLNDIVGLKAYGIETRRRKLLSDEINDQEFADIINFVEACLSSIFYGDILVKINGKPTEDITDLNYYIASNQQPKITITVIPASCLRWL